MHMYALAHTYAPMHMYVCARIYFGMANNEKLL